MGALHGVKFLPSISANRRNKYDRVSVLAGLIIKGIFLLDEQMLPVFTVKFNSDVDQKKYYFFIFFLNA